MKSALKGSRFCDHDMYLDQFAEQGCYVRCPKCESRAFVESRLRVTCPDCGFSLAATSSRAKWFGPVVTEVLARCPSCRTGIEVRRRRVSRPDAQTRTILRCPSCQQSTEYPVERWWPVPVGEAVEPFDPFLGLPLWHQTPCCGKVLWAYNPSHIEFLREYVSASLRERHPDSTHSMRLARNLPAWALRATNRIKVLHAIASLEAA
jgi:ribosomal protein S27E